MIKENTRTVSTTVSISETLGILQSDDFYAPKEAQNLDMADKVGPG